MKRYKLTCAQSFSHTPKHPERTASKQGRGLDFDVTYQAWANRAAMARTIRMQEQRESRGDDWRPCVPLRPGEGY